MRPDLTPKERRVLDLLTEGLTRREVARQVGLSSPGVVFYARRLERLGFKVPKAPGNEAPVRNAAAVLFHHGYSAGDVREALGLTKQRVTDLRRQLGLGPAPGGRR
jgi:transposase